MPVRLPPAPARRQRHFPLGLGLNQVTPPNIVNPAYALAGENYEVGLDEPGGFVRTTGYEAFDGQLRPSEASYWVITFDGGSTAISAGDVIANTASPGASDPQGEALIDAVVSSGSWGGADAAGYVVVMQVTGQAEPGGLADDDTLYVSGGAVATVNGAPAQRGASNDTDDATWLQDAIETARANIAALPGSGKLRGVQLYAGVVWAVRDNAGATAGVLHKATSAGWVAQDLGRTLDFTSGGTTEIAEDDTITGATSGVTAVVKRVIVTSGSWAGGDAAGRLIVYSQSGGSFVAENLNVGATTNIATIAGDSSANALPAGGRYEFIVHNFGGHASTRRLYGVNGVGTAFEWDGATFVPIITGMTTDTPSHIHEHHDHLFLMFPGGSVQNSGLTLPYSWTPRTGATEIGLGDEGTGFQSLVGGQLAIFSRNQTHILTGTSNSDWALYKHSDESGAIEWSVQRLAQPVYYDDRGITALSAVQDFGDFKDATVSGLFRETVQQQKAKVLSSCRVREKGQYRVFFTDKTALALTFSRGKLIGGMPLRLLHTVECITSEENGAGDEEIYFGSDDGFVYQMDVGTSFDGEPVPAWLRPVFNHCGSPRVRKRFWTLDLELDTGPVASIRILPDYSYGSSEVPGALERDVDVIGGGGLWGVANWGDFVWGGQPIATARAKVDGTGVNFGFLISSSATYERAHTITGYTLTWSDRRVER